jgi:hypothetical protein
MGRLCFGLFGLTAVAASLLLAPTASKAIEYPWCAQYGGEDGGARNCGFTTIKQCMDTVLGMGGFCEQNLFYPGSAAEQPKRPRKRPAKPD